MVPLADTLHMMDPASTFQPPEHLGEVQPLYLRHVRSPDTRQFSSWHDVVWQNSLPSSIFSFELVSREGFLYRLLPEEARSLVEPTLKHVPNGRALPEPRLWAAEPESLPEGARPSHWRPLDPGVMKRLFKGVLHRLQTDREQLPLVHRLYEWTAGKRFAGPTGLCAICARDSPEVRRLDPIEPMAEGEDPADDEDELPLFLQGWHKNVDHRHELRIWDVSPEATPVLEFRPRGWLPVEKRFTFGDSDVEVETQYAVDFFKPDIQKVLRHCDEAIRMGVPIYWLSRLPREA